MLHYEVGRNDSRGGVLVGGGYVGEKGMFDLGEKTRKVAIRAIDIHASYMPLIGRKQKF